MYSKQLLTRKTLITPDEVIKQSPVDGDTLDPQKVLHAIEIAEERFVRDTLGWDMYEEIANEKNVTVDSTNIVQLQAYMDAAFGAGNVVLKMGDMVNALEQLSPKYKNLWNERLWKYIAECVRFVAMPEVYVKFSNSGLQKNNPITSAISDKVETSSGIDLKDIKWLMDKWIGDRIEVLKQGLHLYICRHITDYPSYTSASECDCNKKVEIKRTDWVLGVYDDDEFECHECNTHPTPAPPAPQIMQYKIQFVTVAGQTQYPLPEQPDYYQVMERLRNSTLFTFSQEGTILFEGEDPGEMQQKLYGDEFIKWNTPSPEGLRCIIIYEK